MSPRQKSIKLDEKTWSSCSSSSSSPCPLSFQFGFVFMRTDRRFRYSVFNFFALEINPSRKNGSRRRSSSGYDDCLRTYYCWIVLLPCFCTFLLLFSKTNHCHLRLTLPLILFHHVWGICHNDILKTHLTRHSFAPRTILLSSCSAWWWICASSWSWMIICYAALTYIFSTTICIWLLIFVETGLVQTLRNPLTKSRIHWWKSYI